MKKSVRLMTAILVLAMLLSTCISCAETGNSGETTASAVTEGAAATDAETISAQTEFAASNIPDDLKFEGTVLNLLYWDDVPNKEFFVEMDENGNPYKFQWECLGVGRSTSIILHGFEKIVLNIKSRIIGQITEEGLKWIAEHDETYIICDVDIKTDSQS